jgi:hypothetical protein
MVSVIDGFRWCILGDKANGSSEALASVAASAFFLWFGVHQFERWKEALLT